MWDFLKPFRGQNLNCRCFSGHKLFLELKQVSNWILGLKRDLVFQGKLTDATSGFSRNWKFLYTDVRRSSTG